ncbi:hypothetical protein [Terrarubrum flagellatum]|uniref:type II toxin-antitoxin system VapC family toxin n=1 Tax=Terrirubrum flagellatum TaxID=2895980 RepID=UPI003144F0EA
MILVDTSIWIDHLGKSDTSLVSLLEAGQVLSHSFVVGEIALGNLRQRDLIIQALQQLPQATIATDLEALQCISRLELSASGI